MNNFENKTIVITGGNSGIGLSAARQFKAQGGHVITNARNETRKQQTLSEHPEVFDEVIVADLRSLEPT